MFALSPLYLSSKIYNTIICKLFGECVAVDNFNNKYYVLRIKNYWGKNKRICLYKGYPEASKIPPLYNDWIHFRTDTLPSKNQGHKYQWMLDHVPCLTLSHYKFRQQTLNSYDKDLDLITITIKSNTKVRSYKAWSPEKK